MPAWTSELAGSFPDFPQVQSSLDYQKWFLCLCGILGDPVAAKRALDRANDLGQRLPGNGWGYKQAFKNSASVEDLTLLHDILERTWGEVPLVLDPTAGGGSIPFEAVRRNIPVIANDLNPVAAAVLTAGVEIPLKWGSDLALDLRRFGSQLVDRIGERLVPFFELENPHERVVAYIFARTIKCPRTGKSVPLSPNWWLARGPKPVAVRLLTQRSSKELERPEFEIVSGRAIDFDPDKGTVAGGNAVSPWDNLTIDSAYIKKEAREGRMDSILYAVAIKMPQGRSFRGPTTSDLASIEAARMHVGNRMARWKSDDLVPDERFPPGNDMRPPEYGMPFWRDMFSARQLLVHKLFAEEFCRIMLLVKGELGDERGDALLTLLAMMQGKALNWNALLSSWDVSRDKLRSVFARHDYAFTWTFAEFDGARELYPWCLNQIVDAYEGIAGLMVPSGSAPFDETSTRLRRASVTVTARNAADLPDIKDKSITLACMDPPYYDNVMYAELADYFYVWEKKTLGLLYADLFAEELTDKKNEAVANPARFGDAGKRRKELANADYEAKMTAIFNECHRVLRDDGVLTVMFTHKRAEAWDTLGMALMQAGFSIETSWPVNTESEQSLHQAKKNAAASTIMLVCRKREEQEDGHPFFEDVEADVRRAAREALDRFSTAGLEGVDLLLSTYGPVLSVVSSRWPVYSSEADETGRSRLLRPEEALDAARQEVVRLQRQRLVGNATQLDELTDFTLIAWDTFRAVEFPFDDARRLALATGGLDIDDLTKAKLILKKSGTVVLQPPEKRLRRSDDGDIPGVRADAVTFANAIDAVHTVMYVANVDGLPASKALIDRASLATNGRFLACLQGLVNSIPRTRIKGKWVRPEAETLDRICTAYFPQIQIPPDVMEQPEAQTFDI